jgi:hypothetical protein
MKTSRTLPHLQITALSLLAALAVGAHAASGPQQHSLRGLSMGNAFVAVVDDKDALYYNPAGLNLINALGNAAARPGLAAYPRNRLNARVNLIGGTVPLDQANDFLSFFKDHKDGLSNGTDGIRSDSTLFDDLAPFDRRPVEIGVMFPSIEFAMHNYGAAVWSNARVAPYADVGVLLPQAGIETIEMDAVLQLATARAFLNNRLSVGAGYRLANRQTVKDYQLAATSFTDGGDEVRGDVTDTLSEKLSGLTDFTSWGHGIDVGALWQQYPWLRLGASMQNLGMYLNHEYVTPEFTVGAVVTPPLLSTGGYFARKVNLALDIEDIFNDDHNYKPLSKVNFGAEVEQYLWWAASLRVGGGFKGGYWTAGAGLSLFSALHLEAASWAEEKGLYTGHIEDRYYAVRLGVGL